MILLNTDLVHLLMITKVLDTGYVFSPPIFCNAINISQ